MGKLLTCLPPTHALHNCECIGQLQWVRATETLKVPIAPMGDSRFARCLQGGGVAVSSGSVTIDSCTITGNTALYVRAHPQKFPMPQWEICAPMGDSRFARCLQGGGVYDSSMSGTVAISSSTISGNSASSVRAHALKSSHCPDGKNSDVCLPRLSLAQLRTLRSTPVSTCHRDLENFPSPAWETHLLLVVCRAAVSTSLLARSR
jgi:hypothetical protein